MTVLLFTVQSFIFSFTVNNIFQDFNSVLATQRFKDPDVENILDHE